ncbi:PKD domain-containing protein [Mucilaginibacter sp. PAMB04168]|uniref:PKD domain-containing protein n=1 Tax=Mucilaginibacter sp. PAMB04168 TaxID=3138567 RepID=UPI0031F70149
MKTYLLKSAAVLLMVLTWMGCKVDDPELGSAPTSDQVKFSATPTAANANIITFKNLSGPVTKAVWDLGNGQTGSGEEINGSFALAGEYTVKLTILTSGGYVSSTQTVRIANSRYDMLNRPDFNSLTGGANNTAGKTWVIDKVSTGHLGVGPATSDFPEWYQAGPNEKASEGFYDDEMTFTLANNLKYTYANNGNTFVNGANAAGLGGAAGADVTLNYTPPANMSWIITDEGTKKFLTITNGFIAYYTGVSKYQILSISDDEMWLKVGDKANAANAWYLKLIRKGFVRPVIQKPLKAADIVDKFDGIKPINWKADGIVFQPNFSNPVPKGLNTAAKVAYYERLTGDANQYGNLQYTFDYRFDLTTRNKFRVKVFFPSLNNYTGTLKPQVALKLQNSLMGGNAWQTQTEVVKQVTKFNEWVELEFDFSGVASNTLYDQIVLQLGGEGHQVPGIFYVGSIQLL